VDDPLGHAASSSNARSIAAATSVGARTASRAASRSIPSGSSANLAPARPSSASWQARSASLGALGGDACAAGGGDRATNVIGLRRHAVTR
jgi:hypothetical protein